MNTRVFRTAKAVGWNTVVHKVAEVCEVSLFISSILNYIRSHWAKMFGIFCAYSLPILP